jgi:hypothetical protein
MLRCQTSYDSQYHKQRRIKELVPCGLQRSTRSVRKSRTRSHPGVNFKSKLTAAVGPDSASVMSHVPESNSYSSPDFEPQNDPVEILIPMSMDDDNLLETRTDQSKDQAEALRLETRRPPFLRLPGELRNLIYDKACCKELHFGGNEHGLEHHNGINLFKTNRQIYGEMRLLLYALLELHIHEWFIFIDWLLHRTLPQLEAITTLHIHITTFHDVVNDHIDFSNGESSYNVRPHAFHTWPNLPNLKTAHVYIHPYLPLRESHTIGPEFTYDGILPEHKANQIARIYDAQLRLLSANNVQFTGHWSYPISSHMLDMRKICWDYNTLYKDAEGDWTCVVPGCKALWKPQYRKFNSRAEVRGPYVFHTRLNIPWAARESVADFSLSIVGTRLLTRLRVWCGRKNVGISLEKGFSVWMRQIMGMRPP